MKRIRTRSFPPGVQYLVCITGVLAVSGILFPASPYIGYRVVALVMLMTVSVIAMFFDILPVMTAAALSAVIWNFFFIPPLFTFHIDDTEDTLLFLLYFLIAFINAALTFNIREAEKKARDREEKDNLIRLYNTLFNSLSHELRTPVSSIIGALDTLRENRDTLTEANRNELLAVIGKAGFQLNREVDNLLNMSRLESGMLRLRPDWCDMNDVVHSVLRKLEADENSPVRYLPDENLPLFRLDAGIVIQVLNNLVHNAIHHTPPGTEIRIGVSHRDENCVIAVSDNGPGFPAEEIPKVFEKFYRLPGDATGGTGLGLSIVKGFAEALHGNVRLENQPEGGARFIFQFPAETTYINNLKNE
ncbi:MAG TPA: ATP-binding protein [Bacteroidales bacterium]|nr:ATP-binding protein [Bacteroidales bacterium]HPS62739.1 ATP-binding protein [Bacteroidales bacterium]